MITDKEVYRRIENIISKEEWDAMSLDEQLTVAAEFNDEEVMELIESRINAAQLINDWYEILRLKKVEVIVQLTARSISHIASSHHMKLKSLLHKSLKAGKNLLNQFKAIVGNDWTIAWKESGKSFKSFKKQMLVRFHPDKNNGSIEALEISKTITGWEAPVVEKLSFDRSIIFNSMERIKVTNPNLWEYLQNSESLKDFGMTNEPEEYNWKEDAFTMSELDFLMKYDCTPGAMALAMEEWELYQQIQDHYYNQPLSLEIALKDAKSLDDKTFREQYGLNKEDLETMTREEFNKLYDVNPIEDALSSLDNHSQKLKEEDPWLYQQGQEAINCFS